MAVCSSPGAIQYELKDYRNLFFNQSINQYIYNAPWYRGACYSADYAEAKRNV